MARQDSIIKVKGQVGDLSFYKSKSDGYLMRQKGGVEGDRIKNDPAFARTRENGAEFGRAGRASKLLRTALRALMINARDGRVTSRLTREMMRVLKSDTVSARGERTVTLGNIELLQGFEFNQAARFHNSFIAPYTVQVDRVAGTVQIEIPAFVPGHMLAVPDGTTHFKLVAAATELDFEAGTYSVDVKSGPDHEVVLTELAPATLALSVTPGGTNVLFLAVGIEFFQLVNGVQYALKNGAHNALVLAHASV